MSKRSYAAGIAAMLRYEILWRHGGIFLEYKVECRKSFDPFLKYEIFFMDTDHYYYGVPQTVGTGIMGAMDNSYYLHVTIAELIT